MSKLFTFISLSLHFHFTCGFSHIIHFIFIHRHHGSQDDLEAYEHLVFKGCKGSEETKVRSLYFACSENVRNHSSKLEAVLFFAHCVSFCFILFPPYITRNPGPSKFKWLVYGQNGWIGNMITNMLVAAGQTVVFGSRIECLSDVAADQVHEPDRVVCCIGRTHGEGIPTIDYLEQKDKLPENIRDNISAPLWIAQTFKVVVVFCFLQRQHADNVKMLFCP
jgi:hypothetical protein